MLLASPAEAAIVRSRVRKLVEERVRLRREREAAERPAELDLSARDVRELADLTYRLTGLRFPDRAVCVGHTAPLQAFAEAFFATYPVTVWKGSRGLAGKTTMLAALAHLETVSLGGEVTILGGSGQQSKRVHEAQATFWSNENAPRRLLRGEPTQRETRLTNGGGSVALLASQTSARGPHPQRLRMDEIDEMRLDILDAALGQPMSARGIQTQVVLSSTHQYAAGSMTEVIKRAGDRGWPVREWCFRENLVENGGWLSMHQVERTRETVTKSMWDTEYELGEPSIEGRAIDTASVDAMFKVELGEYGGALGELIQVEPPDQFGSYAHGGDWARDVDYTIHWVFRTDVRPLRLVAFRRDGRRPYPQMVEAFDDLVRAYPGPASYDATGLGRVISDLTTVEAEGVTLVGRTRSEILGDYTKAVEAKELESAMIRYAYSEHKLGTLRDFYGVGHLPDTVCAAALAYRAYRYGSTIVAPWGAEQESAWRDDG